MYNDILIDNDIRIADTSIIKHFDINMFGKHISIDDWTYISTRFKLGNYIHIAPHVSIIGGVDAYIEMDDFSGIASGCKIICASDDFHQGLLSPVVPVEYRTIINKPVVFKRFATLGVNCSVAPGVTLAEGSVVGANSFVNKDTEPWVIYGGSPAKPIGKRDKDRIMKSINNLI